MKILVVGGGGREHAIIRKLRENPEVEVIYALPGNAGMEQDAVCVPIGAKEIGQITEFAVTHQVDYAVVAPDDPLVLGCVDALTEKGIPCFGPRANAAIIEGSKAFAKDLMRRYGIPTARYEVFHACGDALAYLDTLSRYPAVIKADGLALGKGVIIAENPEQAREAVRSMMEGRRFGASGETVVIEEYLEGPEVSVLAFTDGKTIVPMVSSMDHKRAGDGDTGPNTGGMGTVAPNPYYTDSIAETCMQTIFLPTIRAMAAEGRPFSGCLYFGLMLTADGPKVIEYNCRFGDPETQVVLPLLESDLLTVMQAVTEGTLDRIPVRFRSGSACCVILASGGYPGSYRTGYPISIPEESRGNIYFAGARKEGGTLVTGGGRVLGCTAVADTLQEAVREAYRIAGQIRFENCAFRHDIGARALRAAEEMHG